MFHSCNFRSQISHKTQANEERRVKLERERMKYKQVKLNLENSKNNTLKAEEIARYFLHFFSSFFFFFNVNSIMNGLMFNFSFCFKFVYTI